ncbi:MAG: lipoprotein [Erysipelotrichaceae bacterium]|nr:lipoprotein [Erysipelotrichaceae bacterium]
MWRIENMKRTVLVILTLLLLSACSSSFPSKKQMV